MSILAVLSLRLVHFSGGRSYAAFLPHIVAAIHDALINDAYAPLENGFQARPANNWKKDQNGNYVLNDKGDKIVEVSKHQTNIATCGTAPQLSQNYPQLQPGIENSYKEHLLKKVYLNNTIGSPVNNPRVKFGLAGRTVHTYALRVQRSGIDMNNPKGTSIVFTWVTFTFTIEDLKFQQNSAWGTHILDQSTADSIVENTSNFGQVCEK